MMVEKIYRQLGLRIRAGRQRLGLTQVQLADRIGISRPALVNIELGRQRILLHDVKMFARVLGTKAPILMRGLWN